MPLSIEQKNWVIQQAGYDPEKFELDEVNEIIKPKVVEQPSAGPDVFTPKLAPTNTPLQSGLKSFAASALPAIGGGLGAAAGVALAPPTGGLSLLLPLLGGVGGGLAASAAQNAIMPEEMKQNLAVAEQENPLSSIAGRFASMPLGGFNLSPTGLKNAATAIPKLVSGAGMEAAESVALVNTLAGAGIGGGTSAALPLLQGRAPTGMEILEGVAGGALFNKPNVIGRKLGFTDPFAVKNIYEQQDPNIVNKEPEVPVIPPQPQSKLPPGLNIIQGIDPTSGAWVLREKKGKIQETRVPTKTEADLLSADEAAYQQLVKEKEAIRKEKELATEVRQIREENLRKNYERQALLDQEQKRNIQEEFDKEYAAKQNAELMQQNIIEQEKARLAAEKANPENRVLSAKEAASKLRNGMQSLKGEEQVPKPLYEQQGTGEPVYPDYTGNQNIDAELARQESAADLEARRLEGLDDRYQNAAPNEKVPTLREDESGNLIDINEPPQNLNTEFEQEVLKQHGDKTGNQNFLPTFKRFIEEKLGVKTDIDNNIVDENNNHVRGRTKLKNGIPELIEISKNKSSLDTPAHEIFHAFWNAMTSSKPRGGDAIIIGKYKRLIEGKENFKRWAEARTKNGMSATPEEYAATNAGAEYIKRQIDGDKGMKKWWNDLHSYWKTRFTEHASEDDFRRILNYKALEVAPNLGSLKFNVPHAALVRQDREERYSLGSMRNVPEKRHAKTRENKVPHILNKIYEYYGGKERLDSLSPKQRKMVIDDAINNLDEFSDDLDVNDFFGFSWTTKRERLEAFLSTPKEYEAIPSYFKRSLYEGYSPVAISQYKLNRREAHEWLSALSESNKIEGKYRNDISTPEGYIVKDVKDLATDYTPRSINIARWIAEADKRTPGFLNKEITQTLPGEVRPRSIKLKEIIDEIQDEDLINGTKTGAMKAFESASERKKAAYLERIKNDDSKLPENPFILPNDNSILYIDTPAGLAAEGEAMNHCVGGYSEACKKGQSFIYSVETPEGRSTVEMSANGVIRQHRGIRNSNPPEANRNVVEDWLTNLEYKNAQREIENPEVRHSEYSPFPFLTSRYDKVAESYKGTPLEEHGKYATKKLKMFNSDARDFSAQIGAKLINNTEGYTPSEIERTYKYLHARHIKEPVSYSLTPNEEKLAAKLIETIREPRRKQIKEGLKVKDGDSFRQAGIAPDGYMFSELDPKVAYTWSEKGNSPEGIKYDELYIKHFMKNGYSEAEANQVLRDYKSSLRNNFSKDIEFAALRKAQGIGLPWELVDKNFHSAAIRYGKRAGHDLSYFKHIQQDPRMLAAFNLRDQYDKRVEPTKDMPALDANPQTRDAIREMLGITDKIKNPYIAAVAKAAGNTVMGAGTAVRNIASIGAFLPAYVQIRQLPLAIKAFSKLAENRAQALETGATKPNYRDFDAAGKYEGSPNKAIELINRYSDFMRKWQGRDFSDNFEGLYYFSIGKELALDNIYQAQKGNKESIRFLEKLATTTETPLSEILKGKFTDDDIRKIAGNFTDRVRGTYSAEGLPGWSTEGWLAPFAALSRFNIEKANTIWQDVIQPMKKGDFAPFIRYTLATAGVSLGIEEINALLSGKEGPDPTLKELSIEGSEEDYLYKAISLAQMGSYVGYVSDLAKMGANLASGKPLRYSQPLSFPLYTLATETVGANVADAIGAIKEGEDPFNVAVSLMETIATQANQTFRYVDARLNPEETSRKEKFRDMRVFEELIGESNQEAPAHVNVIGNQKLKEFKRTDDFTKATTLAPELLEEAFRKAEGNPEKLKKELARIKNNNYQTMPSPERMPQIFLRYLNFLSQRDGEKEAAERLHDFIQQREVNKAKSDLIPQM